MILYWRKYRRKTLDVKKTRDEQMQKAAGLVSQARTFVNQLCEPYKTLTIPRNAVSRKYAQYWFSLLTFKTRIVNLPTYVKTVAYI